MFRRAYAALRPGGLLIFDLLVAGRPVRYETSRAGSDWSVRVRVTEDPRRGRLTRRIVAVRRHRTGETRERETHVLRVPSRANVLAGLRRAGFIAKSGGHYGAVALAPRRMAFLAMKPGGNGP